MKTDYKSKQDLDKIIELISDFPEHIKYMNLYGAGGVRIMLNNLDGSRVLSVDIDSLNTTIRFDVFDRDIDKTLLSELWWFRRPLQMKFKKMILDKYFNV